MARRRNHGGSRYSRLVLEGLVILVLVTLLVEPLPIGAGALTTQHTREMSQIFVMWLLGLYAALLLHLVEL